MNKSNQNQINPAIDKDFQIAVCSTDRDIDLETVSLANHQTALKINDTWINNKVWVQLLPAGKVNPRDKRGDWEAGDLESLNQIVDRTNAWLGDSELLIDYEHQILRAKENGKPAPASGWVKKLEARKDGIWGLVAWTAKAAAAIKAGEYKYISPVFAHEKTKNNRGGKVLFLVNAALTNTPALDMAEVSANSLLINSDINKGNKTMLKELLKKLGLDANSTSTAALSAVDKIMEQVAYRADVAKSLELKEDATPEDVQTALTALTASLNEISTAVGLEESATPVEALSAVQSTVKIAKATPEKIAALSTQTPDPKKFVPVEAVAALQTSFNELKESIGKDKAQTRVDDLIKNGQIVPAMRDYYVEQCSSNPDSFEVFASLAPKLTATQLVDPAKINRDGVVALSTTDEAVCKSLGITKEQFVASRGSIEADEDI